jgi:tRNA pseudouridine38-40 synthase
MSVQQVVEEAFAPLVGGVAPTVAGASRTDAGAHALGQVASVNADIDLTTLAVQRALNVRLPYDIRVLGVVEATPGFHARFQSAGKSYRYRMVTTPVMSPFDRFYVWHSPEPKRLELMREGAAHLVGRARLCVVSGERRVRARACAPSNGWSSSSRAVRS